MSALGSRLTLLTDRRRAISAPPRVIPAQAPRRRDEFEREVARHREQLYRTALRHLRNPDDAQDAVQEALLAAWRHHEQFRGESQWRTWLTRIVLNAAHTQRRRRRPVLTLEAAAASWVPDPRPGPEALYTEQERHERFERLLARLSPPLRAAVKARMFEEQSLREAAGALGISLEALKCRLVRARARLARLAH